MKTLREYLDQLGKLEEALEPMAPSDSASPLSHVTNDPIKEEVVDTAHLSDMLDQLEEHLSQAVGIANDLARYGRSFPGPFAGQIRSYLAPHLESFIDDRRQPGSIASLRSMLIDSGEDDDNDNYED